MTYPPQQPDPYGGSPWAQQGGYQQQADWTQQGGYQQQPYPQPGGYPGGWYSGGEPPKKKTGLIVGVTVAVVLLLGAAFAFAGFVEPGLFTSDDEPAAQQGTGQTTAAVPPVTTPSEPPTANPPPRPSLSTPTPGSGPQPAGGKPKLRKLKAISVVGPTWSSGDKTYTMAFEGWPFAFRTGESWGCISGTHDAVPNAAAWYCRDEANPKSDQRMSVILQECRPCDAKSRAKLNREWLDEPDKAARSGDHTFYVETKSNDEGRYQVDLSHFFGDEPDAKELTWQVGVFIESPQGSKAVVQKALNDIVSQTP